MAPWPAGDAEAAGRGERVACGPGVALYEYEREGWTFHGKGLWALREAEEGERAGPVSLTTLFGSPNFGCRSVDRDAELQFELVARDPRLVRRLAAECDALFCAVEPGAPPAQQPLPGAVGEEGGGRVRAPSLLSHLSVAGRQRLQSQGGGLPVEVDDAGGGSGAAASAGSGACHVEAVGPHLGPGADVWARAGRRLSGVSWTTGAWIRAGSRVLSSFF